MSFGVLENLPLPEFIEQESAADALWVFVHVPRTGGSLLVTELARLRSNHKHLWSDSGVRQLSSSGKKGCSVEEFITELGKHEYKSCSGHLDMAQVARIRAASRGAKVITLLRNPVERVLSEFRNISSAHPRHDEYMKKYPTIEDFVDATENQDRIARMLTPGLAANTDMLKTIDENLSFIGLLEMYPMSFNIVTRLLGHNRVPKVKTNAFVATEHPLIADAELKRRISRNNALDVAIYEHVKRRLLSRREAWQDLHVRRSSKSATADASVAVTVDVQERTTLRQARNNELDRCTRLLRYTPRPLLDPEKRVMVVWSPKSACTTAYVWFSSLCGFVDEVAGRDGFPHRHRIEIYMHSHRYWDTVVSDTQDFHVVRIIRDPYSRAVSIFRHALSTGFADEPAGHNGLDFAKGVSFRQFLEFAASQNMRKSDVHMRPQVHRYERHRKPDTIINISKADMFEQLNALEQRKGWPVTDFKSLAWLHQLESSRRPDCEPFEGEHVDEIPIVRGRPPRNTRFPAYGQLLTPAAKALIEHVYRADFEAYRDYL